MKNWTTIISFTYPHEAHLAKSKLESEGIEVILKDELTAQVNNFYSNAIGGVKLNIKTSDFKLAEKILIDGGFLNNTPIPPNKFIKLFDEYSSKIPIIGTSLLELRLMIIVAITSLSLFLVLEYLSRPTTNDLLTQNLWCVKKIYLNGEELKIISSDLSLDIATDKCTETISFRKNGTVIFPKVRTFDYWLQWAIENDSLFIIQPDKGEFPFLGDSLNTSPEQVNNSFGYVGNYLIEIKDNKIQLKSDDIVIQGIKRNINYNF